MLLADCATYFFGRGVSTQTLTKLRAVVGDVYTLTTGQQLASPLLTCLFKAMGRRRPTPPRRPPTLSLPRVHQWLQTLGDNAAMDLADLRAKTATLLLTAFSMRFVDMAGISLAQSNKVNQTLFIAYRGKTAQVKYHTVAVVPDDDQALDAVAAVEELIARYKDTGPSDALFRQTKGAHAPLSAQGISSAIRRVYQRAGVTGRPYDGRSAAVTGLRASGVPLEDVRLFGRWAANSATIEQYYDRRTPPTNYASRAFAPHDQ